MNKVYFFAPNEQWICDRFKAEWDAGNSDISVQDPSQADVIWLNASWCVNKFNSEFLRSKKVLTTIHHIVPDKFDRAARLEFDRMDSLTTEYHVYNERVLEQVRLLTSKPINLLRYWANQNLFPVSSLTKQQLRDKHGLPQDMFICGSMQRDTESAGIERGTFLPKLEKGSDQFCNAIETMKNTTHPNIHVLLAAWRRQYVISRLNLANVPFSYFELAKHEKLVELYQCLDLYICASRYEGGPQSLLECGLLNVPVVSTPVGIAEQILPSSAIHEDVTKAVAAVPNVENMKLPNGFKPYRDLISSL